MMPSPPPPAGGRGGRGEGGSGGGGALYPELGTQVLDYWGCTGTAFHSTGPDGRRAWWVLMGLARIPAGESADVGQLMDQPAAGRRVRPTLESLFTIFCHPIPKHCSPGQRFLGSIQTRVWGEPYSRAAQLGFSPTGFMLRAGGSSQTEARPSEPGSGAPPLTHLHALRRLVPLHGLRLGLLHHHSLLLLLLPCRLRIGHPSYRIEKMRSECIERV